MSREGQEEHGPAGSQGVQAVESHDALSSVKLETQPLTERQRLKWSAGCGRHHGRSTDSQGAYTPGPGPDGAWETQPGRVTWLSRRQEMNNEHICKMKTDAWQHTFIPAEWTSGMDGGKPQRPL